MEIITRQADGIAFISLKGEVDLYNSPYLKATTQEILESGNKFIAVNLSDVPYIDSSGLSALISLQSALEKRNGGLRLFGVPTVLMKVLQLTKLINFFKICQTEADCAISLKGLSQTTSDQKQAG